MKKGFTLIELLAVIVILAIITLIATPIILGIIRDTKEKATIRSTENYIHAIELAIMQENMKGNIKNIDGNYTIAKSGRQIKKGDFVIYINYDGSEFNEGTVEIKNQKVESLYANINNLYSSFKDSDIKLFKEKAILIEGREFNSIIKNLANNSTDLTVEYEDTLIKKIEFLSFGKLPENYTLETLKNLKNADVSEKQNNSIVAYYDKETQTIFVYSENKIFLNPNSESTFNKLTLLNEISFGNDVNTQLVTTMKKMFNACNNLGGLDLSYFVTNSVQDMENMFYNAGVATTKFYLTLGENFNTSKVKYMRYMFTGTGKNNDSFILNLGDSFDTSNVKYMTGMFLNVGRESLSLIIELGDKFNTQNVVYMGEMFASTGTETSEFILNLGHGFTFNDEINVDDFLLNSGVSKLIIPSTVKNLPNGVFKNLTKLTEIEFKHDYEDVILLPSPGDITGAFYVNSNINTKVVTNNEIIKKYNWASDNRTLIIN